MIKNKQFSSTDNLVKITITKEPYKLSSQLKITKLGKPCKISMFKYRAIVQDSPTDFSKSPTINLLFQLGDEYPPFSQSSIPEDNDMDTTTTTTVVDAVPWWRYAWTMLKSPLQQE